MMNYYSINTVILLACTTLLSGCSPDDTLPYILADEGDSGEPEPVHCQRGIHPIENSSDAYQVSSMIKKSIEITVESMPDGSYNEEQIFDSRGGAITITGIISRTENALCGIDCMSSYHSHNIIATMLNYYNFSASTITGTINYSDNTGSQYTEDGFSTFGNITTTDNGTNISYDRTYPPYDCYSVDTEIGIIDTIYSITSSWDAEWIYSQNGSLTSTGGTFLID
jgi:hypothetical protein